MLKGFAAYYAGAVVGFAACAAAISAIERITKR